MTVTTSAPEQVGDFVPLPPRSEHSAVEEVLGTADHKVLGRLYIAAAIGFGVIAAVAGVVSSVERATLTSYDLAGVDASLQVFSLHRTGLLYLLVIPLTIGLATAIVPLQIGANSVVFPRLAATGFWTWLIGGVVFVLSYLVDGGPGGTESQSSELWVASIGMIVLGLMISSVVLAATVFSARAPGMGLGETPFLAWAVLVAAVVWTLSLASLLVTIVLGFLTTSYGPSILGLDALGGPEETSVLMSWFASRPQILSLLIVGLGVTTDVVASVADVAPRFRRVTIGAIAVFAGLTLGAWAQTALYPPLAEDPLYIAVAFVVALPVVVLIGGWIDTLRRGALDGLTGPAPALAGFLLLALGALLVGALSVIGPLELADTSATSAEFGLVVAGALAAAFAGLVWWAPKIWGRAVPNGAGVSAALSVLLGGLLIGAAELISGFLDQPEPGGLTDWVDGMPLGNDGLDSVVELSNGATAIGWALLTIGLLVMASALASGLARPTVGRSPGEESE